MDRNKFEELQKMSEVNAPDTADIGEPKWKVLLEALESRISVLETQQNLLDILEIHKLNLVPGDILMVTVKRDDLDESDIDMLKTMLKSKFANNDVVIFGMSPGDDVNFNVVKREEPVDNGCSGDCGNCACKQEGTENG